MSSNDDIDIKWKIDQLEIRLDKRLAHTALHKMTNRTQNYKPDVSYIQKTATIKANLYGRHVRSYLATHREGGVIPGWSIKWDTNKKPLRHAIGQNLPEYALSDMVFVSTEEVRSDPKDYNAEVLTDWSSERVDEWFDMLTDDAVIIVRKFRSSKIVSAYVKFDWSVGPDDTDKITKAVQALVKMLSKT